MYKMLQWNCKGFLRKFAEISQMIREYQVICLQETWLSFKDIVSFKDFCVFRNDRPLPRCGGGTMIICKKKLNPIELKSDRIKIVGCDLTAISLLIDKYHSERLMVISFYKPPDIKVGKRLWRTFFEELLLLSGPSGVIVLGDFNAQNEAWGSSRSNSSGDALNEFLMDSPFFFLNNGLGTRVSATGDYRSVPNISITNCKNLDFNWSIGVDPLGSDHLSIVVEFSSKLISSLRDSPFSSHKFQRKLRLSLNNFDRNLFPVFVQEKFKMFSLNQNLIDLLVSWYECILDCVLKAEAVLYDGLGNKKLFCNGKHILIPFIKPKNTKKENQKVPKSPW